MKQKKPKHIAIVMDGNGRWAAQRGLARIEGHRVGVDIVRLVVEACIEHEIPCLSLFTFSHENWSRPSEEVHFLMELFFKSLQSYLQELNAQGVCLRFLGSKDGLSSELCEQMQLAEQLTEKNQRLNLNIALNYTGKWDILNAVKQCMINHLSPAELNESVFASYLSASSLPNPDLMIRTSGEKRISNFFLWQLAYTELFFTDVFWPDFNKKMLDEALSFYASRERRFGKTSQQLTN